MILIYQKIFVLLIDEHYVLILEQLSIKLVSNYTLALII